MEHSRVFVHTSGPNQTWSCHRHSCLFVETVWRFFWVLFHWGKKMNVIDQTRVIRRHELSQRASSHPWGVGRNVAHLPEFPTPPLPLQGSLIQTWEVQCSKNVSQQRKLDHNYKEEVKRWEEENCWGRDHQDSHREDRKAPSFLGRSLNVSSCISIRTGGLNIPNPLNLKLKMLPSPRLFWAQ